MYSDNDKDLKRIQQDNEICCEWGRGDTYGRSG